MFKKFIISCLCVQNPYVKFPILGLKSEAVTFYSTSQTVEIMVGTGAGVLGYHDCGV